MMYNSAGVISVRTGVILAVYLRDTAVRRVPCLHEYTFDGFVNPGCRKHRGKVT